MANGTEIDEIVKKIVVNYKPDKVILFGSYAVGNYNENSDLDFILIKDTPTPKNKRGAEVRRLFFRIPIPLDIKIYTNSEFDSELLNQYSFLKSALKTSKVLYERQN